MSSNQDNFRYRSPVGFNKNVQLDGLENFRKSIEKNFFSKVSTHPIVVSPSEVHLVLELDCNFDMIEVLNHFNRGLWGNFASEKESLSVNLELLQQQNTNIHLEVDELSIFFNDTALIIHRFYEQSISTELETIFIELTNHYMHFTKGLSEVPYEIYLPVFEENVIDHNGILPHDLSFSKCRQQDYFSFWGLYFESENDASIYDLKNQSVVNGKLQTLNR